MNTSDIRIQFLRLEEDGLRIQQMCMAYPRIPISLIPGYEAWLNNLYQYEHRYLTGHHIHNRFQMGFAAANDSRMGFQQLLQCLDIVNKDQLFWDDLDGQAASGYEGSGLQQQCFGETTTQTVNMTQELSQPKKPTVFLSYNWGSETTADDVESRLESIADVHRDKSKIGPWGSIGNFMKGIRETDLVVVIVSDAYLKSVACLYEIMQLLKDDNWINHSMFLVEDSAKGIYNPVGQLDYVKYWITTKECIEEELKGIDPALVTLQADELKRIKSIQLNLNDFMKSVSDRNNPSLALAIDAVVERVRANGAINSDSECSS